ncbi:MAG TPA: glycosyltransferase [Gaiellaceae bacterium]|nr:glycosyltransferase [Gaiellaceae bacterium]
MNVLLVGMGSFPEQPGGLNRFAFGLLDALPDARLVALGPGGGHPRATLAGDRRSPLPLRLLAFRRGALPLLADADVVDVHFALTASALVGRLDARPLVVHFHGPWADESVVHGGSRLGAAAKRALERRIYRRARVVITLSEAFRRLAIERYRLDPARVHVVPPGIDLERFSPGDRRAARRRLGLPEEAFVVASLRRLAPRMGLDVLVAAWPEVRRARPDALLVIAGDGPERARLESVADEDVRFLGSLDEERVPDLYRAADVCAVPSRALEGFGLVVAEALACGTPSVVSDVGGLPEAVGSLDPSLVVPAGDGPALAARLLGPLPDETACRAHAELLSWSRSAERHLELYAEASRRRVVFLDHTAKLSGGELALARTLPALDVDAHVVLGEEGPLAALLRRNGIATEVLPFAAASRSRHELRSPLDAVRTLVYAVRLARRLRALRPDAVHANSLKSGLYGGIAARLAGVPFVWHVRDRISADYLPRPAVALVRAALRFLPAAVIANSRATAATLPREATVVPSPVDVDEIAPVPHDGLRVGILGRIAPWKGQHVFVDAFSRAFPDGGAVARIIGAPLFGAEEEAYEESLHRLPSALALNGRLEFAGFRDDVAAELASLDVLVHASTIPEPFGQSVAQGMAAGLAVVATAEGGPAEYVEPGRTGLLYPPGDVDALAAALRTLADDPDLRARLGAAARERAHDFAPETVARLLESVYANLEGS